MPKAIRRAGRKSCDRRTDRVNRRAVTLQLPRPARASSRELEDQTGGRRRDIRQRQTHPQKVDGRAHHNIRLWFGKTNPTNGAFESE
jgi:hypothetical protein